MKKVGLKAIAAALALLMTASLSAPAAAEAADKLLVTSAGGNVLVITQDMVDSEGEFVLSGEDFDKVVLPADVEIKNLYVDGCEIGEFTVEGGNNPKVQLWDAQIKNVTVSAPSLVDENKAIAEYLDLYKGKESAEDFDVDGFFKNVRETNERLNSLVPEIRLMGADMESSEQAIGAVTLAGNAKVNFTKGKTPDAVNVAFNSAQMKMDVTIEGYKGDINVDQTTGKENAFGILNIKTKKSEIGNVNVKAQGNANIALRSSDSKAATVNFDSKGDASAVLTVAAPTDNLKVAGSASNATVKVLTSLISADIQGKSITMDLGPAASVETATIAGSGNVVSGSGDLVDCTIAEGTSAAVQIPGAAVAGDNSYQPIISAPSVGGSSSGSGSGSGTGSGSGSGSGGNTGGGNTGNTGGSETVEPVEKTFTFSDIVDKQVWGNKYSEVDENGKVTLTYPSQYAHAMFAIPDSVDTANMISVTLNGFVGENFFVKLATAEEGASYNGSCAIDKQNVTTVATDGSDIKYFVIMSAAACTAENPQIITVDSVTFTVMEENEDSSEDKKEETTGPDLTSATECDTNAWQVHHFTDYNLVDYVGQTVSFTVDMAVVCEEGSVEVLVQDSGYKAMYQTTTITDEWKTFTFSCTVPDGSDPEKGDYADLEEAYLGFRWKSENADYANYAFYYKNFTFTGTPAGGEEDNKQETPAVTEIIIDSATGFTKTVANDGEGFFLISEKWLNSYDGGNNFVALLPEALKQNEEIAQKFTTLAGIKELVKHFEFSLTLTESTKAEAASDPITVHSLVITSDQAGEWVANWSSNYLTLDESSSIKDQVNVSDWDAVNIEVIRLRVKNLEEGSTVSGSYSIKAVLK